MPRPHSLLYIFLVLFILGCTADREEESTATVKRANQQSLGSSANDFLAATNFGSIRLEIAYVAGFEPTQNAIDNLGEFLSMRCNKPGGVVVKKTLIPATTSGSLDIDEVLQIENDTRTIYNVGDDLAVWVFFADQNSAKDEGNSFILGTAYRNTSCVVFEKTLKEFSNGLTGANLSRVESTTLNHEFGHLFGLVDLGSDMVTPHQDTTADDGGTNVPNKHCTTQGCLMYFQTVNDLFNMAMGTGSIAQLDAFCLADLKANGGK